MLRITGRAIPYPFKMLLTFLLVVASVSLSGAQGEQDGTGKQLWTQAESLRSGGDNAGAFEMYNQLLAQYPTDNIYAPMALYRMCMVRYHERNTSEALNYVLKMVNDYPESNACKTGYGAFYLTSIHLIFENNSQATVDLVKSHVDNYAPSLNSWEWGASLTRIAQAYVKLGKPKEAVDFLAERLPQCTLLLTYPDYYETLVQIALAQKDNAAALSAARQGYALCDFDETKIKQMANLVRRTFMATGDFSKGLQFLASQDDPQAPNPLKDVAAVKVTDQQRDELLKAVGEKLENRCIVYLYCGDHAKALADATQLVATAPDKDAVRSIMCVSRVFKAADLGVHRANQFIEFARTGKGDNPCSNPGF